MNIWEILIPFIIELIDRCIERDGEEKTTDRLKNPGLGVRWELRKLLIKNTNLRGPKLWSAVSEGMEELKNGAAEELVFAALNPDDE